MPSKAVSLVAAAAVGLSAWVATGVVLNRMYPRKPKRLDLTHATLGRVRNADCTKWRFVCVESKGHPVQHGAAYVGREEE